MTVSPNHHLIAADLSEVSPFDALAGTSLDASGPAFTSLLGVTICSTSEDVAETLWGTKDMCPGTRLVVDYLLDAQSSDPATHDTRLGMFEFVARRGEPMHGSHSMKATLGLMANPGLKAVQGFRMTDLAEV